MFQNFEQKCSKKTYSTPKLVAHLTLLTLAQAPPPYLDCHFTSFWRGIFFGTKNIFFRNMRNYFATPIHVLILLPFLQVSVAAFHWRTCWLRIQFWCATFSGLQQRSHFGIVPAMQTDENGLKEGIHYQGAHFRPLQTPGGSRSFAEMRFTPLFWTLNVFYLF